MAEENRERYKVSVVTPCYKIDMDLFVKCFESLKDQTIGFDEIEWVIVSHNSSDEQYDKIREIVKANDNIRVYKLDNDRHTPSSPRNHGIDRATGKYVGFLDADDTYYPGVVEECYRVLEEENAQMVSFRMDTDSDDDSNLVVKQFSLLDQTKRKIVLEKGNYDQTKVINGPGLMITTKLYELDFLNSHGIRFDEDVPFAEDNLFNLHVFANMKKVVILPQLIGYRYFLNGGSLVQSFDRKEEDIWPIAIGVSRICETGLSYGLYMNSVMCSVFGYLSAVLITSKDISFEFREKVSELLTPYIRFLEPVKPSKMERAETARMLNVLPKIVIAKPRLMSKVHEIMKKLGVNMETIIKKNT
ncbi:MAG: glycosyltransferase family 2 protein [Lachnospiraceae bacterium]|nr:glycosyltransferase family 2 protein [Lachnospiraceae bacterium]